jgi:hypothetical protein
MADQAWTVKELTEALKKFPLDAKVYYEMGPNGPGTIGRAQYVNPWGDAGEMAVLLER